MLITEAYRQEQARLHATGKYGVASLKFGGIVSKLAEQVKAKALLDYGCGSLQSLRKVLTADVEYRGYEPAVPEWAGAPEPADLVVCIDVLEHIEPDCLAAVLNDLRRVTVGVGFFSIHTGPAVKTLSDGRNAHLIQQPMEWWFTVLSVTFQIQTLTRTPDGFFVVVT